MPKPSQLRDLVICKNLRSLHDGAVGHILALNCLAQLLGRHKLAPAGRLDHVLAVACIPVVGVPHVGHPVSAGHSVVIVGLADDLVGVGAGLGGLEVVGLGLGGVVQAPRVVGLFEDLVLVLLGVQPWGGVVVLAEVGAGLGLLFAGALLQHFAVLLYFFLLAQDLFVFFGQHLFEQLNLFLHFVEPDVEASIFVVPVAQLAVLSGDEFIFLGQLSVLQLNQFLQFLDLNLVLPNFLTLGRGHRQGSPGSLHLQFLGKLLPKKGIFLLQPRDGLAEVVLGHGIVDGIVRHIAVVGLGLTTRGPGNKFAILDDKNIVGMPVRLH